MSFKNRGELYRDTKNGKVAGVCAGLADYFGWETWLVRIVFLSGILLGSGFLFVVYIAAWFILDKKKDRLKDKVSPSNTSQYAQTSAGGHGTDNAPDENESIRVKARIWQAGEPPKQAFHDIQNKFKRLEGQLITIERYVTSTEFTVAREINQL
ncbi:envelope stress response membrane protein PspC [Thalassotalea agariperforans]